MPMVFRVKFWIDILCETIIQNVNWMNPGCSIIIVFCIFAGCAPQSGKPEDTEQPLELYQVDESVVAPEWKDSFLAAPKEEGDLRIIQISDPHYFSMSITDQGVLYQNAMAKAAGRDALHIGEILDAFYEQVQEEEPDVLRS